jgi:alanyl-tRNA synthetase
MPTPRVLTPNQLRSSYLEYFAKQSHAIVPSSPLVPDNDPTTLFTGSGMQPMVPYLLGEQHPLGTRIVDSQKSFRSQDIEEVGDNRHTTYFEMLGNWSLGDYFKKEQLSWFFGWLVEELGFDPQRLYVSVYGGNQELGISRDEEAITIWQQLFAQHGIEAAVVAQPETDGHGSGRIFLFGDKKNWWSRAGEPKNMPVGEPGGPDSEVFYDFGEALKLHENSPFAAEPCHVNCDCGRFMEIGNNVFMTYQRTAAGFEPLKQKNIDFGGGFERILAALGNDPDVFKTPLFSPIIHFLETQSGQKYASSEEVRRSMRVIADHLRAAVMLAGDGVVPGNKEQGYFSRRLLRRAIRYGKMIGIDKPFIGELVPVITEIYNEPYPEVVQQQTHIVEVFTSEEQKFRKTLEVGLRQFKKRWLEADKTDHTEGKQYYISAVDAFDLYQTYGFPVELTVEIAQQEHVALQPAATPDFLQAFEKAKNEHADQSRTASAGKFKGGLAEYTHITTQYHTATHLLQAALRQILGTHVQQQGSNITDQRLRFDFSHPEAVTPAEIKQVEQIVNAWVQADLPMTKQMMTKTAALESGAIAFFKEKYPEEVSVYTVGVDPNGPAHDVEKGWISKELCGGPHVTHTGEIGLLKITKEQSAGAGIRRIYMELA